MPQDLESATERTALLYHVANDRRLSQLQAEEQRHAEDAQSVISSAVRKEEQFMAESAVGERLPYNDYTTIDWLHDLVKDSYRFRHLNSRPGLRYRLISKFDACSGWIAVVLIGALTACVAFVVDVAVVTVADWKFGFCRSNPFLGREACCRDQPNPEKPTLPSLNGSRLGIALPQCDAFRPWSTDYASSFVVYVFLALLFGIVSSSATMLTKKTLPAATAPENPDQSQSSTLARDLSSPGPPSSSPPPNGNPINHSNVAHQRILAHTSPPASGKTMYMASGSGIPEIKTILSGFTIPHFLSAPVLLTKAFGAIFAVATGLNLGKEGPFVHISTCVGYLVATQNILPFEKYEENGRKVRELLSAACASGLSVAFGAPIGGVLFSYEEISTYFGRKVLWRAFLCSLVAAMVLKGLNPTGTGKLVLFETNYGSSYEPVHYLVFLGLGVAGGVFGGVFCKANFWWSRWFRGFGVIRRNPVLEVAVVVVVTACLQFPSPVVRETGDVVIKALLVDCRDEHSGIEWVCVNEAAAGREQNVGFVLWLVHGMLTKLFLTTITFGIKVPSGVIIPSLDAGALFGRLIGQFIPGISPGIFAMVGSAAFLAGVSRMTISLCVIMFELTGELEYVVPNMLAILVAKWIADAVSKEGVYDVAQTLLGHPFLDPENAISVVKRKNLLTESLTPPKSTMDEITVVVPESGKVEKGLLARKVERLKERGLMDAGLVIVQERQGFKMLQGYISQGELEFGLEKLCTLRGPTLLDDHHHYPHPQTAESEFQVRLLSHPNDPSPSPDTLEADLSTFVDRTPLTLCRKAPLEYAVEMFSKLGLRYLCVVEEGSGALVGVVLKKRLVGFLERLEKEED